MRRTPAREQFPLVEATAAERASEPVAEPADLADLDREAALARLFDLHYPSLLRLAVLLGADDAEDVVAEAFYQLYRRWQRLHTPEAAASYLRSVICNQVRMRLRHLLVVRKHAESIMSSAESAENLALLRALKRGRMADMTLPALPEESFQRVLCVVAHPDDMEYGTSAAVARWTARGIEVGYLVLTRGEAGMPNPPEETARLRVAEQQAACALVGVKHLTVLEHPDGVLVYGLDLRRDICREIRRFKPDVVLSTGHQIETPYGFDQADHRAAGLATLDAVRDAGNRWVFPDQVDDEGLEPHSVRWLIIPGLAGFGATHGVDVTGEPLRRGIASLEAHAAYLAALPDHPAPDDIIPMFAAMSGKAMGVEHAVLFRAHDLQAPPDFFTEAVQD